MENIFALNTLPAINGIWSDGGNTDRPAVVFLSAGLLRSQGPNRLYVETARALQKAGISSLRFDLSGVGDSLERAGGNNISEKTVVEVKDVLDAISAQKGLHKFVLMGLCSGAHDGVDIAVQDKRVVGLVSIDGYSLKTRKYWLYWCYRLVLPRLMQKKVWLKMLRKLRGQMSEPETDNQTETLFLDSKSPELILERLQQLLKNNVATFCLFTGGVINQYSYEGQLADANQSLRNSDKLTEMYLPQADHLFLFEEDRIKTVNSVVKHIKAIGSPDNSASAQRRGS